MGLRDLVSKSNMDGPLVSASSSSSGSLVGGKSVAQWISEIKAGQAKPAEVQPRQAFRNGIVQARIHAERDKFIASIRDEDVLQLAQSYHGGDICTFFKPPARGSYNVCYFVHFPPRGQDQGCGDKWVVRLPLEPCLAHGSANKLRGEVATMQLVAEKTTIPIPSIRAYAFGDGPQPFPSFIILQYLEGQKLSVPLKELSDQRRDCLYASLADIYLQLRRLDFPAIGRLAQKPRGCGSEVGVRAITIHLNMQELEGLAPSDIEDQYYGNSGRTLSSANAYAQMLLEIGYRALIEGPNASSEEEAGDQLYHIHIFRRYVEEHWIDRDLDSGPFVLVHGDLEPFNLLLDDDMNVVAVLDWEWSRVVPLQLFTPPLWLSNTRVEDLSYGFRYKLYLQRFDRFLGVLRARERQLYGNELLADEWERAKKKSGFLVANALENWTAMDWFANRFINFEVYGGKSDLQERVDFYVNGEPGRQELTKKMAARWNACVAELEQFDRDSKRNRATEALSETPQTSRGAEQVLPTEYIISQAKDLCVRVRARPLPFILGVLLVLGSGTLFLSGRQRFLR
ncbi:hypothetical protein VTK73DRAFT_9624 [Phialemonium thermophilum]|uniref:Aminoglycoside phosphotransferase domain-containing protein n=1 Tax=Phialemonium thermophilum TaxID=223376 RepID=A0ABR3XJP4_9PEZI